jgi:hypothetical protein
MNDAVFQNQRRSPRKKPSQQTPSTPVATPNNNSKSHGAAAAGPPVLLLPPNDQAVAKLTEMMETIMDTIVANKEHRKEHIATLKVLYYFGLSVE